MKRVGIAAVFTGPRQPLQIRRFDVQSPETGEILVRVIGCTLCGSDLISFEGRRPTPLPTILGHEIIGRIEEFGASDADSNGRHHPPATYHSRRPQLQAGGFAGGAAFS